MPTLSIRLSAMRSTLDHVISVSTPTTCGGSSPASMNSPTAPGRRDPFFPVGNGEALAREVPGARLLVLERASPAIPNAVAGDVAAAMLEG